MSSKFELHTKVTRKIEKKSENVDWPQWNLPFNKGKLFLKFILSSLLNSFQLSWLLVLFAQNVYYLYVSRVLFGIAVGGTVVIVPLFFAEIANVR